MPLLRAALKEDPGERNAKKGEKVDYCNFSWRRRSCYSGIRVKVHPIAADPNFYDALVLFMRTLFHSYWC